MFRVFDLRPVFERNRHSRAYAEQAKAIRLVRKLVQYQFERSQRQSWEMDSCVLCHWNFHRAYVKHETLIQQLHHLSAVCSSRVEQTTVGGGTLVTEGTQMCD